MRTSRGLSLLAGLLVAACGPDTTWRPAFDASDVGWLMNVWGPSRDDLFAVGGSLASGAVVRFDGEAWSEMEVPAVPLINWCFGFGAGDVHAVGNEGTILHYDGSAWSAVASPTDQDLWGVWGAARDDVWAVGGSARLPATSEPTLLHFDGASWSAVALPPLERPNVDALFKVWGSSARDVYVVGDRGIVLHYDGAAWTELFVGAEDDLIAVWGTGPNDVVAIGGRGNGIVSRFDGTEWHSRFLTPLPGLNGVWMREPGVAHVVGLFGTLATLDAATLEATEEPVDEGRDFHSVFGVDGLLVSVGGNLAFPATPEGIAHRRELEGDE